MCLNIKLYQSFKGQRETKTTCRSMVLKQIWNSMNLFLQQGLGPSSSYLLQVFTEQSWPHVLPGHTLTQLLRIPLEHAGQRPLSQRPQNTTHTLLWKPGNLNTWNRNKNRCRWSYTLTTVSSSMSTRRQDSAADATSAWASAIWTRKKRRLLLVLIATDLIWHHIWLMIL